jgi:uncharacterized protein (TIRG00374 family)
MKWFSFKSIVKLVLALLVLVSLIKYYNLDWRNFYFLLKWQFILPATFMMFVSFLFITLRWKLILRASGREASFWKLLHLNLMGLFFNYLVPGGLGGDAFKVLAISRDLKMKKRTSFFTVLIDRLVGLFVMVMVASLMMIYHYELVRSNKILGLIFVFCSSVVFFFVGLAVCLKYQSWFFSFGRKFSFLKKHQGFIDELIAYLRNFKFNLKRSLPLLIFLTLASLFVTLAFMYLAVKQFPSLGPLSVSLFFMAVPIGFVLTAVPLSPGGVGVGQLAFFHLFNLIFRNQSEAGVIASTSHQLISFVLGLLGVSYYLLRKTKSSLHSGAAKFSALE